jgi:7-cyano-7-deazaguanine reductase
MRKKSKAKEGRFPGKNPTPPRSTFSALDRRYDVADLSAIEAGVLETFPYEYPGRNIVVNIDTDEFTAVCPYSGLPDFATLRINYIPGTLLLELRSVKYYLLSYRNVGIFQEHAVNRILQDLAACCKPKWMQVMADYRIRGGVHSVATVESGRKGPIGPAAP